MNERDTKLAVSLRMSEVRALIETVESYIRGVGRADVELLAALTKLRGRFLALGGDPGARIASGCDWHGDLDSRMEMMEMMDEPEEGQTRANERGSWELHASVRVNECGYDVYRDTNTGNWFTREVRPGGVCNGPHSNAHAIRLLADLAHLADHDGARIASVRQF